MPQHRAKILENRELSQDFYRMRFAFLNEVPCPQAGQFFNLKISAVLDPLLRRPFAFSDFKPESREAAFLYQIRGKGTRILSQKKTGELINILAPLGKGFDYQNTSFKILIAGGIGLGPILFLARKLAAKKEDYCLIAGFRNQELVPRLDWPKQSLLATEDGSQGVKGTVIDALESFLGQKKFSASDCLFYACGPWPMLRACHQYAEKNGAGCLLSVEQYMACGIGACNGCVIPLANGENFRVCTEGPVIESRRIAWNLL